MTAAQVFNWFCKEQRIIPIIREMYYRGRPRNQKYALEGVITEYLSLEEFMNSRLGMHGMSGMFSNLTHTFYYSVGWNKYDEFREKYDIPSIEKKWNYFVKHNVLVKEDCLKIGDVIEYNYRHWGNVGDIVYEKRRGRVVTINLYGMSVTLQNVEDNTYYTLYANNFKENGIELDFYIKRNRRKYYGVDR